MVTSLWIVLLMTIDPLWSPWWTSPFPPNLVLYIVKKLLARNLSSPTVLIVELSSFNTRLYLVTSLWIVLLMTIEPSWLPCGTSPFPNNLVLYIVKTSLSAFKQYQNKYPLFLFVVDMVVLTFYTCLYGAI